MMIITIARKKIEVANPDKILFAKDGYTKGDIMTYYHDIAPAMFKYVKNRIIVMQRFPDGIDHEGFYHKDAPSYFPDWIERCPVEKENKEVVDYVVANSQATIVYLAGQGCLTPHIWLSTVKNINYPDKMIFDLDPGHAPFAQVQKIALIMHDYLLAKGLKPFVMTTGSKGLHIVIPIKPTLLFDQVREIARAMASELVSLYPKLLTLELRKEKRGKKIFLDYLRNGWGATGVAPYAIRPYNGAPVATPIDWDEVSDKKLISQRYTIKTVFKRLEKKGDPWATFAKSAKKLLIFY